ncbi:L,D-transpeptidase family protein [Streptomyces roseirectus]|uniref:L,D-transpeptidase family protein n=1 Tax=Streptomyces roseirectus TaxID=2768066 RepID=A0A7H0IEG5_9ACTN|nr:Ig-like domain-containing protein [Streptomyces roseirectus]QNP71181.1 L,D-transpeptidase family protein [Streptomyces roseirectus]
MRADPSAPSTPLEHRLAPSIPSSPGGRAPKTYGTAATAAAVLAVALTAALRPHADTPDGDSKPAPPRPEVRVGAHTLGRTGPVDPDAPVTVTLNGQGSLTDVTLRDDAGHRVAGRLDASSRVWRSTHVLRAATHYVAEVRTEPRTGGTPHRTEFTTARARSGLLTITLGPGAGETRSTRVAAGRDSTRSTRSPQGPADPDGARSTQGQAAAGVGETRSTYGVGQIITAHLSHPVPPESRALLESHLRVTSTPQAASGAWHWLDATTLHYRPRTYWPARAEIRVTADDLAGLRLTDHLRVAPVQPLSFATGAHVEAVIDAAAHRMSVLRDGMTLRVIPVTTGKEGYRTRAGVKVVLDKQAVLRMRSTTIGIPSGTDETYDLPVRHAVRLTRSGEFLHAAPWATSSFGRRDVSHGCVGMSDEDAAWLFLILGEGDITRTVHTRGQEMTPFENGVGDWNMPWRTWLKGSALHGRSEARPAEHPLRPSAS